MKAKQWRVLPSNSMSGQPTFDIMSGDSNPENWEMVAEVDGAANAHLIAAAPELLEALKAVVQSYDGIVHGLPTFLAKCCAAISHAEANHE